MAITLVCASDNPAMVTHIYLILFHFHESYKDAQCLSLYIRLSLQSVPSELAEFSTAQ